MPTVGHRPLTGMLAHSRRKSANTVPQNGGRDKVRIGDMSFAFRLDATNYIEEVKIDALE